MSTIQQLSQQKQMVDHVQYCKTLNVQTSKNALQLKLELIKQLHEEFLINQTQVEERGAVCYKGSVQRFLFLLLCQDARFTQRNE